MSLLRHNLMADAAEDIIVQYALLLRELAEHDVIFRCLKAVRGDLMIKEHDDLGRIPNASVFSRDLIESLDC